MSSLLKPGGGRSPRCAAVGPGGLGPRIAPWHARSAGQAAGSVSDVIFMFPSKSLDQSRHFNLFNNNSRIKKLPANHGPKLVIYFCLSVDKSFCKSTLQLPEVPVPGRAVPAAPARSRGGTHGRSTVFPLVPLLLARLRSRVSGHVYMFSFSQTILSIARVLLLLAMKPAQGPSCRPHAGDAAVASQHCPASL